MLPVELNKLENYSWNSTVSTWEDKPTFDINAPLDWFADGLSSWNETVELEYIHGRLSNEDKPLPGSDATILYYDNLYWKWWEDSTKFWDGDSKTAVPWGQAITFFSFVMPGILWLVTTIVDHYMPDAYPFRHTDVWYYGTTWWIKHTSYGVYTQYPWCDWKVTKGSKILWIIYKEPDAWPLIAWKTNLSNWAYEPKESKVLLKMEASSSWEHLVAWAMGYDEHPEYMYAPGTYHVEQESDFY